MYHIYHIILFRVEVIAINLVHNTHSCILLCSIFGVCGSYCCAAKIFLMPLSVVTLLAVQINPILYSTTSK